MSALANLGHQFRPLDVKHEANVGADIAYTRKRSVGTISGYAERYQPQKTLGLKHRPNSGLTPKYRDTGFHG